MNKICPAILFDTRSIQKYIFAESKLKTNVGASYLVDRLYDEELIPLLKRDFAFIAGATGRSAAEFAATEGAGRCFMAMNGGGNGLVIFSPDVTPARLKEVVAKFSANLLVKRPGLKIGAAIGELDLADENYDDSLKALYARLKENQNNSFNLVNVPYTGLTVSCGVSGQAANYYDGKRKIDPEGGYSDRFFSQETAAKALAAQDAQKALQEKYPEIAAEFAFPLRLDDLGKRETENYFAIIHIDGNNMGEKFRRVGGLQERQILSQNVKHKTEGAFGLLLAKVKAEYSLYSSLLSLGQDKESSRPFLPLRPIILGGDDVTFVCPAKLAIHYAKIFMEAMLDENSVPDVTAKAARSIDACGGVAILPGAYPFFRGYRLAEELCDAAKQKMRSVRQEGKNQDKNFGTSWLDFAFLHGEGVGDLDSLREREYTGARGNLHFGPYQVGHVAGTFPKEHRYDIENLLAAVSQLQRGVMQKGKIKELRRVLAEDKSSAQKFLAQLSHLGQKLPAVYEWNVYAEGDNALWSGGKTPYVDAIEMMDFLPTEIGG
ncbi:MAG: hypothetical protein IJ849_01710 [Selenomonadaceae bacterium]|nr:hypothetical protein [Selenomonadaceae bacterium]